MTTPTPLVELYSLSRKPWSQVLTLNFRICEMAAVRPSLPRPSSAGRILRRCWWRSFAGTRSPRMRALAGRGVACEPPPEALMDALSSASLTNGTMRDLTASMSCIPSALDDLSLVRFDLRTDAYFRDLICSSRPDGGLLAVPVHLKSAEDPGVSRLTSTRDGCFLS